MATNGDRRKTLTNLENQIEGDAAEIARLYRGRGTNLISHFSPRFGLRNLFQSDGCLFHKIPDVDQNTVRLVAIVLFA